MLFSCARSPARERASERVLFSFCFPPPGNVSSRRFRERVRGNNATKTTTTTTTVSSRWPSVDRWWQKGEERERKQDVHTLAAILIASSRATQCVTRGRPRLVYACRPRRHHHHRRHRHRRCRRSSSRSLVDSELRLSRLRASLLRTLPRISRASFCASLHAAGASRSSCTLVKSSK